MGIIVSNPKEEFMQVFKLTQEQAISMSWLVNKIYKKYTVAEVEINGVTRKCQTLDLTKADEGVIRVMYRNDKGERVTEFLPSTTPYKFYDRLPITLTMGLHVTNCTLTVNDDVLEQFYQLAETTELDAEETAAFITLVEAISAQDANSVPVELDGLQEPIL